MALKILKLTSTEDIMGDLEIKDGKYIVSSPARLVMMPTQEGGMAMAIMPWVPFSDDDEIVIREEALVAEPMNPADDIRNEYSQRFGSGIVTPPKDLIV